MTDISCGAGILRQTQYKSCLPLIRRKEAERVLYLAVPLDIYESFFKLEFTQLAIADYQLKIIVYNIEQEAIFQWIN
ncbi:MAG: hypothetical protein EA343_11410 [Nodularia sp. (in: Bacteria)]|nr:MAG: hypothetical protein EA343_11410 [Nodularia sp. (in: cyanobacteria)]